MARLTPINLPQFGDEYDGRKMRALVEELERLVEDLSSMGVKIYTVATLPPVSPASQPPILVSDEVGGTVLAFSDGTDWRRVTDRAVVS